MASSAPQPHVSSFATAAKLRRFGPVGVLAMLVILAGALLGPLVAAPLVILWVALSRTPWQDIGYGWPERKGRVLSIIVAAVAGVAFKLLMKAVVMPLLGADPINRAYHFLAHNPAAVPGMLFSIVVGAGWGEETFWRGYLFERLGKLLGGSAVARVGIVLTTSTLFGLAHYAGQGHDGVMQALITGTVFGSVFMCTGRLFPVMIAHCTFDLVALAIIYWDVEAKVAHVFFR
jgi:membrane protease YdiL (CAAX protease family)